ncbi:hypothetical protein SteCoe_32362 [Stentor coeruleus]|uniref:Ion transport domain-containing protein n=1 Tax=Stentor coeruleus TaxID=5963 RepID=A0A1R2AZ47_9CILI|nr:hypothetical protein SteCoe_32362 [Stentor coeruleus]
MCYYIEEEQNAYAFYLSFDGIKNDLPFIIKNSSSKLDYFLSQILIFHTDRVYFGNPKDELPIIEANSFSVITFQDFSSNEGEKVPLKIKEIPFLLPFGLGSNDSKELISAIISCSNTEIFRTEFVQCLINQRWEEISNYVYLYTMLLWGNLLIIYFVLASDSNFFACCAILVNIILLCWEAIQFAAEGKTYFKDSMNIFDLFRFFITAVYLLWHLFGIEYSSVTWFMITFNLIRGLTGFRAFNNTRYFIRLLQMCIVKIKDFFIIFIYATLSIGLMNSISTQQDFNYYSIWSSPFGIIVGKTDTFYENNFIQSVTFILSVTTNMIIMLNMIISILGDVFDEFQLNAEIYNYTEMAQVILETEQILSYLGSIENLRYLHICVHAYESTGNEWKGKTIDMRDYLKDEFFSKYLKPSLDENLKQISKEMNQIKTIENKIQTVSEEVKAAIEEVKAVKTIENKVEAVSEEVKAVSGEVKIGMNNLNNRVEDMEKSISNIQGSIDLLLKILNK